MSSLYARAHVSYAVAGRELSELGRGMVGDVSTPMQPGERVKKARRARLMSLTGVDRAVLAELSEGVSWEILADALCLDVEETRRRYEPTWDQWQAGDLDDDDLGDFGVGLRGDDLESTAEALDQWFRRHAEPWDTADTTSPVRRVLARGEPTSER